MDIKCNFNSYSFNKYQSPTKTIGTTFCGVPEVPDGVAEKRVDMFIKRPAEVECAAGLLSLDDTNKKHFPLINKIKNYAHNYVKNIKHTYEHKIIFSLIEKELLGYNTIDSLTHDADKMILYILGFPKSFVSDFHRKHSAHHPESGKKMNLRSMLCDNIASSPEFKPEKKYSLREHYKNSKLLQSVDGFKNILEKYNYGENINFNKIKSIKDANYTGVKGVILAARKFKLFHLF